MMAYRQINEAAEVTAKTDFKATVVQFQIGSSVFAGYDDYGYSMLIKHHVRHLRQKIEPNPNHPIYILTIPEVGYMLVSHAQDEDIQS